METDKNIFPEIKIFTPLARLARVGRFIGERLYLCDERPNTGAAPLLDSFLDGPEQLQIDFEAQSDQGW